MCQGDMEHPRLPGTPNRRYQLKLWAWDVFICHAGGERAFGMLLHQRLLRTGLRLLMHMNDHAPAELEAAIKSSHVAVVLLSVDFFRNVYPQQELSWFLEANTASRNTVVSVFMGITAERCDARRPAALRCSAG